MATSLVQIRVDEDLKTQAAKVYGDLGIDISTAVRMFLKRSVMVGGIPFSMTIPSQNAYQAQRGYEALRELSAEAKANGTAELSLDEIDAEISAVRANRRRKAQA